MKKKILLTAIITTMCFSTIACGKNESNSTDTSKSIESTISSEIESTISSENTQKESTNKDDSSIESENNTVKAEEDSTESLDEKESTESSAIIATKDAFHSRYGEETKCEIFRSQDVVIAYDYTLFSEKDGKLVFNKNNECCIEITTVNNFEETCKTIEAMDNGNEVVAEVGENVTQPPMIEVTKSETTDERFDAYQDYFVNKDASMILYRIFSKNGIVYQMKVSYISEEYNTDDFNMLFTIASFYELDK